MDGQRRFAVIGTDARLAAAGRALARAGFAVGGPEQTALADYILLPLPLDESRTPLAELLRAAKPGALALGGKLSAQARQIAAEAGVELVDYFAREELILCNAIPTAEGCIGILMAERTRTLWNSAILLAGFGPVGQALGVRLAALGAQVTVAARRPAQRALAESFSLRAVDLARLEQTAPAFDTVVNTIPAPVLTEAVLAALRPGSLIVDLASKPGGTDFAAARRLGHRKRRARLWPGRSVRSWRKGREHHEKAIARDSGVCGLRELLHTGRGGGSGRTAGAAGLGAAAGDELCGLRPEHPLWPGG